MDLFADSTAFRIVTSPEWDKMNRGRIPHLFEEDPGVENFSSRGALLETGPELSLVVKNGVVHTTTGRSE